eukprot:CAMPEP_0184128384 /NCGR_PEP_ID=MMETSP0974-20121125/26554_1 /TAXON_ID=483370 /ORGANISM="non described non described, Strain CCMP2097" /LENGTH=147 /DNA_ID=CAMNT_0026431809 /DNA_START=1 /DNA_END=445 /DNA_ORIENTATION=-
MHHLAGITIPGSLSSSEGITFKSLGAMNPLEAWAAVPAAGVSQIFGAIALVDAAGVLAVRVSQIFGAIALVEAYEMTHKDGKYAGGDAWFQGFSTNLAFDPLGFGKADAKMVETMKLRELKNGRLAMIGIMGFVASSAVPGSVPMLH